MDNHSNFLHEHGTAYVVPWNVTYLAATSLTLCGALLVGLIAAKLLLVIVESVLILLGIDEEEEEGILGEDQKQPKKH